MAGDEMYLACVRTSKFINYRGLSLAISEFIFEYIMLLSRLLIKFNDLFFFYLLTN